ncbi:MAG: hypothetical protein CSA11_07370 [Chloroflexi bacterium]|nr:MAG: hypothetical protein CSA11_07370 [Chloroflexota bacterium]
MSEYQPINTFPVSAEVLSRTFNSVMARVYLWMTLGLVLTTAVSFWVLSTPSILQFLLSSFWIFIGLFIVQIVLVIAFMQTLNKLSTGAALAIFFVYAALNGVTMSTIFLAYNIGIITMAFGVTAVVFVLMSVIGLVTKQDLTKWGPILFFGLIGLIVATVVNMFLGSNILDLIITYFGVLLFMGLVVYDTKYIKQMTYQSASQSGNADAIVGRISTLGALKLYLDFINLFLFILRLLGRRR